METPIALHSVAHRVSHQIPAESEMSRQNRATPPQIKVSHLSPDPPCRRFLSFAAGRGRGGLVEGIAALLGSENGSRYRGVSQLQSHQSRYSVQLRTGSKGSCNKKRAKMSLAGIQRETSSAVSKSSPCAPAEARR